MVYRPGGLPARNFAASSAPREAVAIQGAVAQLQGLAHEREDHEMLARAVGDPQGVDADLARLADPGLAGLARDRAGWRRGPARRPPPAAAPSRSAHPSWCGDAARRSRCPPTEPSTRAASPTSFISRLTARLMFGEIRIGISPAAASSSPRCPASKPVVPTTSGTRRCPAPRRDRQRRPPAPRNRPSRQPTLRRAPSRSAARPAAGPRRRSRVLTQTRVPVPLQRGGQAQRRILGDQLDQPRPIRPSAPWIPTEIFACDTTSSLHS